MVESSFHLGHSLGFVFFGARVLVRCFMVLKEEEGGWGWWILLFICVIPWGLSSLVLGFMGEC